MENKKYEILEQKMCKELEMLEAKYAQDPGKQMGTQDVEMINKLAHALKSIATYQAMKEAEEYGDEGWSSEGGNSGRRGRSITTGRYISRDMSGAQQSYANGYSEGYSEAMNQMSQMNAMNNGNSGHYPMPPYSQRRW